MFCTDCGTSNRDEALFCRSCGNRLSGSTRQADKPNPALQRAVAASPPALQQKHSTASAKSLTVAGYLSILFAVAIVYLVVSAANDAPPHAQIAPLAAAVVFIGYGSSLIKRHRSAVWFGWFLCGVFGLGVVISGFVPLFVFFWLLFVWWATYVHFQPFARAVNA